MSPAHDDPRFLQERQHVERRRRLLVPGTALVLAVIAALLPVLFHHRYASGETILYLGDSAHLQFPRYVTLCSALQRGELPLWQTLVYGGAPFHGNPENPTLYPPTLLFGALTTPAWTINLTILVHLGLAALGMFLLVHRLARRFDIQPGPAAAGALVGATLLAFSHFTRRDHVNLVAYGAAHALIPWMLLAADGLINGPRPRRSAALVALAAAAIFMTGGLYVIPYAYLALALWMVALGLLGGREACMRTLRLGGWVAIVAGLIVLAKLLPYRDWLPTTNRAGRLPLEAALGTTLDGSVTSSFAWSELWLRTSRFPGGPVAFVPALLALALLRRAEVRVALGLVLLGFGLATGGLLWRFFYEFVPPFDQVRSAVRAWTLVNAFLPLLGGLGTAWLVGRVGALRRSAPLAGAAGVAVTLALVPLLTSTDPREKHLQRPRQLSELRSLYPRWGEAAQLAGERWRVGSLDRTSPEGRNEQFITSLLGVETVSGYQGHVWPARLARHLYGAEGEPAAGRETRLRRLGVLSARWLVETDPTVAPTRDPAETDPPGIEGTVLVDNPHARARLFLPAAAIGVVGDGEGRLTRALLDHARFPLGDATLIELPWQGVPPEELAALDAVVVVAPPQVAGEVVERLRGALPPATPVFETAPQPLAGPDGAALVDGLAAAIESLARAGRTVELGFEREGARRALLHVLSDGSPRGRFAVASEPWSWYPGWRVEGTEREPALRVADGVVTAFLLPPGVVPSPLIARYAPPSTRKGLAFGAVGLVLALGLIVAGSRR